MCRIKLYGPAILTRANGKWWARQPLSPRKITDKTLLQALLEESELGCSIGQLYSGLPLKVLLQRTPALRKQVKELRQHIRYRKAQFQKIANGYPPVKSKARSPGQNGR